MRLEVLNVLRDVLQKVIDDCSKKATYTTSEMAAAKILGACETKIREIENQNTKLTPYLEAKDKATAQSGIPVYPRKTGIACPECQAEILQVSGLGMAKGWGPTEFPAKCSECDWTGVRYS